MLRVDKMKCIVYLVAAISALGLAAAVAAAELLIGAETSGYCICCNIVRPYCAVHCCNVQACRIPFSFLKEMLKMI